MGAQLRIGRPSKYSGGAHRSADEPRWIDILDKYRTGDLEPLRLSTDAQQPEPPPLSKEDVESLERTTRNPSRTIVLRRILEETGDAEDVPDNEDDAKRRRIAIVDGVVDEVTRECSKHGNVVDVTPFDEDHLKVRFSLVDNAILALATLRHKLFDDRKIDVEFIPDDDPPFPSLSELPPPPPPPQPEFDYSTDHRAVPPPSQYAAYGYNML